MATYGYKSKDKNGVPRTGHQVDELLQKIEDFNPADKQDVINDLDAIRSGAAAGSTAYQKPVGGIPLSDLARAVQEKIAQSTSVVNIKFTQEGTYARPTWSTNGHTYSELTGFLQTDTLVFVTMHYMNGFEIPFVLINFYYYFLVPIQEGSLLNTDTAFALTAGSNNSIVITQINIYPAVDQTSRLSSDVTTKREVVLYGEKISNNSAVVTGKIELNDNGVAITTSNGGAATINGSEIVSVSAIPQLISGKADDNAVVHNTDKGTANGVATLDSSGLVPVSQLPSYVDDVIEAYARDGQTPLSSTWLATGSASGEVIVPETGKIYVLMVASGDYAENSEFRWGGTTYVKLNDGGITAITNAEIDVICSDHTIPS